jgi:hypothetical protein
MTDEACNVVDALQQTPQKAPCTPPAAIFEPCAIFVNELRPTKASKIFYATFFFVRLREEYSDVIHFLSSQLTLKMRATRNSDGFAIEIIAVSYFNYSRQ